ncbi:MAG TPA: hypothetical protein DCG66_01475 [Brevundimonas sp.]|jgi:CMP-N,N'-diacetyllegionaminic acid synthase|nr:hypothetical protein [Brevundimonas sp.]HAF79663.1 hypothetical protein [Brevundimonas sp.]|tara:strand:- start:494 stop:1228 length:735 start_codon:yes stop_codon:yes gene_type:complete
MEASIDCYIPARIGSQRVPIKNLRMLGDRPLIAHAIDIVTKVPQISSFCVNTDHDLIASVAYRYKCNVYLRDPSLAVSTTSTDEILYDYATNSTSDHILILNPTAPFVRSDTLEAAALFYLSGKGTLFSTTTIKKHAIRSGKPVNFDFNKRSPRTQELQPISFINFIFIFVNRKEMISAYERSGFCLYTGTPRYWPIEGIETWDIDDEFDFRLAELALKNSKTSPAEYAPEVAELVRSGVRFER